MENDRIGQEHLVCGGGTAKRSGKIRSERMDKHAPRVDRTEAEVDDEAGDDEHPPAGSMPKREGSLSGFWCIKGISGRYDADIRIHE